MTIKYVELLTTDLDAVREFYHLTLGFEILEENDNQVVFKIGNSRLAFKYSLEYTRPTYHYALTIPENQFQIAKKWLSERVELVKDIDENDEFDFVNWNAHAIYFFDSVGNIGELIARHDLNNASEEPFLTKSITGISEIALPQRDVLEFAKLAKEHFEIPIYKNGSAAFAPLGTTEGLFICVPLQRIWYPTQDLKSDLFPVKVEIENTKEGALRHDGYYIFSKKS